jgi:glutamate carboxypeptidase
VANEVEKVLGEGEAAARDRVLARLRTYVEVETPSRHEEGIRKLAGIIARDLEAAGASVALTEAPGFGAHLVAEFEGSEDGAPVVILSHMDTVHPIGTLATQPFVIRDDRAEGPGIYDMKAGIAVAVEALLLLRRQGMKPRRPLRFVLTCDEEIGSHSSLPIITEQATGAAAVLVTEPCIAGGSAKTARKGVLTYRMDVTGRAAHAGVAPQAGVSAIAELAAQIQRVYTFARHDVGTTLNVGVVGGGTASNVVAAAAFADIDVRVVEMNEGARIHEQLMSVQPIDPAATVSVHQTEKRPPLERSPAVVALYE